MLRDTLLVAGKDLRIELRSRVVINQMAPFALLVLVLFAFALGPDRNPLITAAPGLFWMAVLFSTMFAVQRSFSLESAEGLHDSMVLAGIDPAGFFAGKLLAIGCELFALEVLVTSGIIVLYGAHVKSPAELLVSGILGTVGLAAAGTIYGALVSGMRLRETLLPLLFLPVASPVLIAGTRAWQIGLQGNSSASSPWLGLLGAFAALYICAGIVLYGPMEDMK
ncbi:MAG: heme exporter protein CcmB [Actinobacteria bacterium]|nr:heme exporter protein CcmB [Actinomycetota bacterium]